jgi:hypothetical protein
VKLLDLARQNDWDDEHIMTLKDLLKSRTALFKKIANFEKAEMNRLELQARIDLYRQAEMQPIMKKLALIYNCDSESSRLLRQAKMESKARLGQAKQKRSVYNAYNQIPSCNQAWFYDKLK